MPANISFASSEEAFGWKGQRLRRLAKFVCRRPSLPQWGVALQLEL